MYELWLQAHGSATASMYACMHACLLFLTLPCSDDQTGYMGSILKLPVAQYECIHSNAKHYIAPHGTPLTGMAETVLR